MARDDVAEDIQRTLEGAGINPLTASIINVLLQPAVQHHFFGFRKGSIVIDIKDEVCLAVRVQPELRRGYEIFPR